ncbi:MAG: methyltransferase [Candidatus Hodarchaeota archaeon]
MQLKTTQDVENLLRIYLASAAVATALELGLFWQLTNKPLMMKEISQNFNIPYNRCHCWVALLMELGLLKQEGGRYFPSSIACNSILEAYSPETWAFMAQETREGYPTINNLPSTIAHPNSVWEAQGLNPPDYITKMTENPRRAERFTRMLYELHKPLADKLAKILNLTNVNRLMDLGGGSGVVSLALLKRYANLNAVVVDIENVCRVGREIADETLMGKRITYHAANFMEDDLPSGFDLILECDVGIYQKELLQKLLNSLNKGGRLVIISNTNEKGAWLVHSKSKPSFFWFLNAFSSSLEVPSFKSSTIDEVETLLLQIGYQNILTQVHEDGIVFIQANK